MIRRIPASQPLETSAFAANPLVASVLRENVIVQDGRAVIPLWPHWTALLGEARTFGRVLSISRNPHAVLGRISPYPQVEGAACGHCARAADGTMEFYFSRWNRAAVSVGETNGKWIYAVEFQDAFGETLHKICLTEDSDFEAFREWVELNQAVSIDHLRESEARESLCEGSAFPEGDLIFLETPAVGHLFARLIDENRGVHVVVGNEGFVQGAELCPEKSRVSGQWTFLSDECCGLHLRHARLAEVCLQRVHWHEDVWVLRIYEPEGRLACVFAPAQGSDYAAWDRFLLRSTAPYQLKSQKS